MTNRNYESLRMLLAQDGVGVSFTDVVLAPSIEDTYGYQDRTEVAYCISGSATLADLDSGMRHEIRAGVLWVASPGSRFTFSATEPTRLVCGFSPTLEGHESGLVDNRSDEATDRDQGRPTETRGDRPTPGVALPRAPSIEMTCHANDRRRHPRVSRHLDGGVTTDHLGGGPA
ncbi:MAG: ectoine synthase [Dermatophilaceae bacterium]